MPEYKYTTYHESEQVLEASYRKQKALDVFSLYESMKDNASRHPLPFPPSEPAWGSCSDMEFQERINIVPILLRRPVASIGRGGNRYVSEDESFGVRQNFFSLMIHRQYNFLLEQEHSHDYVEIYYV